MKKTKREVIYEILEVFFPVKREATKPGIGELTKLRLQLVKKDDDGERYDSEKRLLRVHYESIKSKKEEAQKLNKKDFAVAYNIARDPKLVLKEKRRALFNFLKENSKKRRKYTKKILSVFLPTEEEITELFPSHIKNSLEGEDDNKKEFNRIIAESIEKKSKILKELKVDHLAVLYVWARDPKSTLAYKRKILSNFFKNYAAVLKARSKKESRRKHKNKAPDSSVDWRTLENYTLPPDKLAGNDLGDDDIAKDPSQKKSIGSNTRSDKKSRKKRSRKARNNKTPLASNTNKSRPHSGTKIPVDDTIVVAKKEGNHQDSYANKNYPSDEDIDKLPSDENFPGEQLPTQQELTDSPPSSRAVFVAAKNPLPNVNFDELKPYESKSPKKGKPSLDQKNSNSEEESVLSHPSDEEDVDFPVAKCALATKGDKKGRKDETHDAAIVPTVAERPVGFLSRIWNRILQIGQFFRNLFRRRGRNRTTAGEVTALDSRAEDKATLESKRPLTKEEQHQLYVERINEFKKENPVFERNTDDYAYSRQRKKRGRTEERLGEEESKEVEDIDGNKHQIHNPSELEKLRQTANLEPDNSENEPDAAKDELASHPSDEEVDLEERSIIFEPVDAGVQDRKVVIAPEDLTHIAPVTGDEARPSQEEETLGNRFNFTEEDANMNFDEEFVDSYKLAAGTNAQQGSGDESDDKLNTTVDELIHELGIIKSENPDTISSEEVPNLDGFSLESRTIPRLIKAIDIKEPTAAAREQKNNRRRRNRKKRNGRGKKGQNPL